MPPRKSRKADKVELLESQPSSFIESNGNEDQSVVVLEFSRTSPWKRAVFWSLVILTGGLFLLVCYWLPWLKARLTVSKCSADVADCALIKASDNTWSIVPISKRGQQPFFVFRYVNHFIDLKTGTFEIPRFTLEMERARSSIQGGISQENHAEALEIFGSNLVDVPVKNPFRLLVDEILHPFFVFQIWSVAVWMSEKYIAYAVCIAVVSIGSAIIGLVSTRRNLKNLQKMSRYICPISVVRDGKVFEINSDGLVPGDVVELNHSFVLPCDMCLVSGACVVNESMLTGESVPVMKTSINDDLERDSAFRIDSDNRHTLFSGTKVIETRLETPTAPVRAVVVGTGFLTAKGRLVRSIMYPKPSKFKFYSDSFKFVGVLAVIALLGFFYSINQFLKFGVSTGEVILNALDLVTIVVPPALPACMVIGTEFALRRLRKIQIFCISPPRVNVAGMLDFICFDKTGTLTEEGLDVLGVQCVTSPNPEGAGVLPTDVPAEISDIMSVEQAPMIMKQALGVCHGLTRSQGELIGDPLDLIMFLSTKWEIYENIGERSGELTVVAPPAARFNSHSALNTPVTLPSPLSPSPVSPTQNSSGLVPASVSPADVEIKIESNSGGTGDENTVENPGTFDCVPGMNNPCDAIWEPVENASPEDQSVLGVIKKFDFTSETQRMCVIAKGVGSAGCWVFVKGAPEVVINLCSVESVPANAVKKLSELSRNGYRVIGIAYREFGTLPCSAAAQLPRANLERDLQFLGFLILENKLKPESAASITELRDADIDCAMVTGDHLLTAISVASACNIVPQKSQVIVGDLDKEGEVLWRISEGKEEITTAELFYDQNFLNGKTLAITGKTFAALSQNPYDLDLVLTHARVYARMLPDQKQLLVEFYSKNKMVGFCGDGANDCGALKASHVGVSLSDSEASIAAPFTSKITNISCVAQLIREGRTALVTSFQCFKFMALYSMIQFVSVMQLFVFNTTLSDWMFLWIDFFIIIPLAVSMARTDPYPTLSRRKPEASLVTFSVLSSIVVQIIIQASWQIVLLQSARHRPWFIPLDPSSSTKGNLTCMEATIIFYSSVLQYISVVIAFSIGPPFRRPAYTNSLFVFSVLVTAGISIALILTSGNERVDEIFEFMGIPNDYRIEILISSLINFVATWLFEKLSSTVELLHFSAKANVDQGIRSNVVFTMFRDSFVITPQILFCLSLIFIVVIVPPLIVFFVV